MAERKLSESLLELADYLEDAFPFDTRIIRAANALRYHSEQANSLELIEGYWRDSVDASFKNTGTILNAVLAGVELARTKGTI